MKRARIHRLASATVLGIADLAGPTYAQTRNVATEISRMDEIAAAVGGARVQQRISADFSAFAGSESNARNLVTGLHAGGGITLTSIDSSGGSAQWVSAVKFTIPVRPMGYGEIYVGLSLAKQQLAAQGITNPTPEQLQLALTGGTVTSGDPPQTLPVQGVLQLRSQGVGWAQIASKYRINLGPVLAGMQSANQRLSGMADTLTPDSSGAASGSTTGAVRQNLLL